MNYWKGRQKEKRDRTKNEKMMDDDDDDDDDSFTHTASSQPRLLQEILRFKIIINELYRRPTLQTLYGTIACSQG